jgi:AhpD family alkylhydroperoxidase
VAGISVSVYAPPDEEVEVVANRLVSSITGRQVRYVTPVAPAAAQGLVAEVYAQATEEMRLVVPPLLLHSPAPETLAAYWMVMRETLLAGGVVDRLGKETVAAAVAVANTSPYCVDWHSTGLYELSDADNAEAIVADRIDRISDARIRALARWARHAHLPDSPAAGRPLFTAAERAELVGVVVGFHYLTRMVNVFLTHHLIPPHLGPRTRRRLKYGIARLLGPTLREPTTPGRSLPLLPAGTPPQTTGWAEGNRGVAEAIARAYPVFEAAGRRSLPVAVRRLVERRLTGWRGEEPGSGPDWCEELIAGLPEAHRPAGRLALLTAFASDRVDERVVGDFRRYQPTDRELVEAAAWASFAAARHVGGWQVQTTIRG